MLRWRLLAATFILVPLFGLLALDFWRNGGAPGIWLVPVGLLMVAAAAGELLDMIGVRDGRPSKMAAMIASLAVFSATCVPLVWELFGSYPVHCPIGRLGWLALSFVVAVMGAFIVEMWHYQAPGQSISRIALTIFVVAYSGMLSSFLVLLRSWGSNGLGMAALVSMILITKLSDTGAYFVGKSLGRHKLIPRLSPGKTIEGSIGGFVAAIVGSGLFFQFIGPRISHELITPIAWWRWMVYGLVVCAAGMLGDLAESLIKRDSGRKDSSRWMPGLGGVLDVVDSLLFAAPAAYICWASGWMTR